jgi:hypothetical protein
MRSAAGRVRRGVLVDHLPFDPGLRGDRERARDYFRGRRADRGAGVHGVPAVCRGAQRRRPGSARLVDGHRYEVREGRDVEGDMDTAVCRMVASARRTPSSIARVRRVQPQTSARQRRMAYASFPILRVAQLPPRIVVIWPEASTTEWGVNRPFTKLKGRGFGLLSWTWTSPRRQRWPGQMRATDEQRRPHDPMRVVVMLAAADSALRIPAGVGRPALIAQRDAGTSGGGQDSSTTSIPLTEASPRGLGFSGKLPASRRLRSPWRPPGARPRSPSPRPAHPRSRQVSGQS